MLGNAVPSLIAEVLARAIRNQLLDAPSWGPLHLLPPRRDLVPAPEAVMPVPSHYHHLAGSHAEHPGTGKGRRAATRGATTDVAGPAE